MHIISPIEAEEYKSLWEQYDVLTKAQVKLLATGLDGGQQKQFLEQEAKITTIVRRLKELSGIDPDASWQSI